MRVTAWLVSVLGGLLVGGSVAAVGRLQEQQRRCEIRNSIRLLSDPPSGALESCGGLVWVYVLIGVGVAAIVLGSVLDRPEA